MTRRFIEFVLMQAQQVALTLGQLPGPDGRPMEPNLPVSRLLIDQIEMIREKTRGNLSDEEADLLNKVIADLQLAFVEAGNAAGAPQSAPGPAPAEAQTPTATDAEPETPDEGKRKFSKSYG